MLPLFKSVFVVFHLLNATAAMVSEIYKTIFESAIFVLEVSPADKTVLMFPTLLQKIPMAQLCPELLLVRVDCVDAQFVCQF